MSYGADVRLAVIIPTFNEADVIGACLDHLQPQDVDEIIVVDNNSTDATVAIALDRQRTDPRIRVLHEPQQGVSATRATGFDSTSADILGRIDADTRVAHDWVAQVRHFFSERDDFVGVSGLSLFYDSPFRRGRRAAIGALVAAGALGNDRPIANIHGANMAIRASAWQTVRERVARGGEIHEDVDLALCITAQGGRIASSSRIWAELSPRRNLMPPRSYMRHIRAGVETQRRHGRAHPVLTAVFVPLGWAQHAVVWVGYRAWDPHACRWSVRRVFTPADHRVSAVG